MKILFISIFIYLVFYACGSALAARDYFFSIEGKNFYELFGVTHESTPADIKSAWRRLIKQHHPDHGSTDLELSQKINAAYNVLINPQARRRYDLWLSSGLDSAMIQNDNKGTFQTEAELREDALKKNAEYVLREAAKVREKHPNANFDEMAEQGRFFVIYVMRYMPDANYTTEELWRLITEFGQNAFNEGRISADSFAMLAGGALQYLKERADYGGFGDEKKLVRTMEIILDRKLTVTRAGPASVWDSLWKIINNGKSYYGQGPTPSNCASSLTQVVYFTQNGVTYQIPITISVTIGK